MIDHSALRGVQKVLDMGDSDSDSMQLNFAVPAPRAPAPAAANGGGGGGGGSGPSYAGLLAARRKKKPEASSKGDFWDSMSFGDGCGHVEGSGYDGDAPEGGKSDGKATGDEKRTEKRSRREREDDAVERAADRARGGSGTGGDGGGDFVSSLVATSLAAGKGKGKDKGKTGKAKREARKAASAEEIKAKAMQTGRYDFQQSTLVKADTVDPRADVSNSTMPLFADGIDGFKDLGVSEKLCSTLRSGGIERPTRVQLLTLPALMASPRPRASVVKAETGTGKTLAYALPIVDSLAKREPRVQRTDGTMALIMAPTRELCQQIVDVMAMCTRPTIWLVTGAVMGGEKKKSEKARLRKGITILVATPGRLLDHLENTKSLHVHNLQWLVLDEADRLLDMGFERDLVKITTMLGVKEGPQSRVLVSATYTSEVWQFAESILDITDPVRIGFDRELTRKNAGPAALARDAAVKAAEAEADEENDMFDANDVDAKLARLGDDGDAAEEADHVTPHNLKQKYSIVPCRERLVALVAFLRWQSKFSDKCKVLAFINSCDSVEFHYNLLREQVGGGERIVDIAVHRLHGKMAQRDRMLTFSQFSKAKAGVLLCTDVAARGLDMPNVNWILQYDSPGQVQEYVHRVGRTARLGAEGQSMLFLQPHEEEYINLLSARNVVPQAIELGRILHTLAPERRDPTPAVASLQKEIETVVADSKRLTELARTAFTSGVRAYSAHPRDLKPIFSMRDLHLGHFAKTFGLREPPGRIAREADRSASRKRKDEGSSSGGGNGGGGNKKNRRKVHKFNSAPIGGGSFGPGADGRDDD